MGKLHFSKIYLISLLLIFNCLLVKCDKEHNITSNFRIPDFDMVRISLERLPSSRCTKDVTRYINGIENNLQWAMNMFDATVKFPFGLLYGNSYQLGNFDECIDAYAPSTSNNGSDYFSGQYCLAEISVPQMKSKANYTEAEIFINRKFTTRKHKMHWAVCIPSSCLANETELFVNGIFEHTMPNKALKVKTTANSCYYKTDWNISIGQAIYSGVIGLFLLFVLSSTCYHSIHIYKKQHVLGYTINMRRKDYGIMHEAIVSFSLIKNIRKLIEIKAKSNDFNLDCICGIRTLSMAFILAGHSLTFLISSPALNKQYTEDAITKVQNAMFLNNPLLVDSFLLVSGFLMCRLLLIEMEKRTGKVNILVIYLGRYFRLTPSYLVVILFYCTFLVDMGDGPLWKARMTLEQERCLNSWWTNILYVNNYIETDQLCMFQSWYLSVDTQLFVLAPLIVFPLWYKPIVGEVMLSLLCIASGIVPFMITCTQHLDPTLMIYPEEINDLSSNYYFQNYYIKTHMRANAYLMGMLFGYIVHKMQFKNAKIPFIARILLGTLAIIAGVGAMFSIIVFYQSDYIYDSAEAALYASLHRVAWCFAIGWTIMVCVTSNSYVNNFLSWKAWGPFSKLTYCAYLVNGIVELYSYGQTRSARYLSTYSLGSETAAHIVMTLLGAFILCILFESPIHNIEKLLIRVSTRKNDCPSPPRRTTNISTSRTEVS